MNVLALLIASKAVCYISPEKKVSAEWFLEKGRAAVKGKVANCFFNENCSTLGNSRRLLAAKNGVSQYAVNRIIADRNLVRRKYVRTTANNDAEQTARPIFAAAISLTPASSLLWTAGANVANEILALCGWGVKNDRVARSDETFAGDDAACIFDPQDQKKCFCRTFEKNGVLEKLRGPSRRRTAGFLGHLTCTSAGGDAMLKARFVGPNQCMPADYYRSMLKTDR